MLAAIVNVGASLIFIETNSFVPLIGREHGANQALIITAALAARDLVAIAVGLWTIRTGQDASSSKLVVGVLVLAAISAVGVGLDAIGSHPTLILWCALQGGTIGVGIAATNLLTIGGSSDSHRSLGMAAGSTINRVSIIVIPIALGFNLQLFGLKFVFFTIGGSLILLSLLFFGTDLELKRLRGKYRAEGGSP